MSDPGTSRHAAEPAAAAGDAQLVGNLLCSAAGVMITVLVDFGVPLTAVQQRDVLSLVVTAWAAGLGVHTWWTHTRAAKSATGMPAPAERATGRVSVGQVGMWWREQPGHTFETPPCPPAYPGVWPAPTGPYTVAPDDGRHRGNHYGGTGHTYPETR